MTTTTNHPDALIGVSDLAALVGVPVATIYQWRHKGYGPVAVKLGKYVRYRVADVERWLDEQTEAPRQAS